ncbi:MAG: methylmalonyl-CoA mutase family protein, partial [Candidatus Thorarchaeota archaeon]
GGTQSLHTNSRDEALSLPTEESVQIALRTQQIIAYESGVVDTVDPLAGSYYIENLTNEIESKAMEYIEKIDNMGGAPIAIEKGFVQREIHDAAYQFQRSVDEANQIVVGVNKFIVDEEAKFDYLRINPAAEKEQLEALQRVRSNRDEIGVQQALSVLRATAVGEENLMPLIIKAVKSYATLGEICGVLREIFGEYKAPDIL